MATIALLSPGPLAGKTTIAAALAQFGDVQLTRSGADENAEADRKLFATLSKEGAAHTIIELPAGEKSVEVGAKTVVVARGDTPIDEVTAFCKEAGEIADVALNRAPVKRAQRLREAYEAASMKLLATVPEDRVLAAPLLSDVITAIRGEASYLENGAGSRVIDNPVVASISSDPGQGYFLRESPSAVIVRSDKPDLQLAALNAGAPALIITGSLPILGYVTERAEADEIPLVRTLFDTIQTVNSIEDLFGALPFSGSGDKLRRVRELLADSELPSLIG